MSAPVVSTQARRREDGVAASLLLLFALALFARLLFTNRVLASGDILHYFYPYRAYAAAALRGGEIPLWNPFIFNGVPFLANPQAAVLYPLHWPLSWLTVTQQIYWSAALHTWLLGLGGYLVMRHWRYDFASGLTTGLVLAGSGFYGGLIGHINQMNGAAWLPWALLVLEWGSGHNGTKRDAAPRGPKLLIASGLFGLLVALMLLAGHTQTVYINLFGLGIWTLWPLASRATLRAPGARLRTLAPGLLILTGGSVLGALISAAQLLPTLELSGLGLRSGGLSYSEASSFSLKPLHLHWTLLPSYGLADLSVIFGTLGYTEFVAYVGLIGLALAGVGAWRGQGRARTFGLLFAALGLFLAAGRWNPFYFVLYEIVPGFDLFRAPARWMMLYTLGMAVLAGIGMARLQAAGVRRLAHPAAASALVTLGVVLLAAELLPAARALPHTHPTAPQAVYDLRTAPAHLARDPVRTSLGPGAAGRFLSMSTITFDPGDMADYRRILVESDPPQLDERAFSQLVIAIKSQEILAPNLPLFWRIPAVDGFDGGVLPLQRYIRLLPLFIPHGEPVPDGRLREQIRDVPPGHLLDLVNAQYVITDKVRDLWFDDVYYDRQIGARLSAAERGTLTVEIPQPFSATHVDLIGYVDGNEAMRARLQDEVVPLLEIGVDDGGETTVLTLRAGGEDGAHWADGTLDSPLAPASATVALRDVEAGRQEYRARLALPNPMTPTALRLAVRDPALTAVVQAVTLYDARTGMFTALLPSDRGRFRLVHSGDVKVYEYLDVRPRAYLTDVWQPVADADEALAVLERDVQDAAARPVVEGITPAPLRDDDTGALTGTATLRAYGPAAVTVDVVTDRPALLVLTDSNYPGWHATVDGAPAPIYATNLLFRGVPVPPGAHTVHFEFAPRTWRLGRWISLLSLAFVFTAIALGTRRLLSSAPIP